MLRGRAGLSPVMIGRTSAVGHLRDLFEAIDVKATDPRASAVRATDLPTVALIAGEAGIGKTRLIREFLAGLTADVEVHFAYGDPGAVSRSLALFADLLPHGAGERGPMAAVDAIHALPAGRRTVLVLEDLHWADADSAWVIDRLVTHPWPNVLVIGTYRPDDLSRRLPGGDLLSRLERRASVERVHLDRLTRPEVTSFLAAVYGEPPASAAIEALYNRTGGNPFFLEELLTCCAVGTAAELVSVPLPWSLEEVVQRQLDGLEPAQRQVVDVAAVCGSSSRFDVLAEVAGLDEAQLIAVLRSLIDRGLMVETGGERFVFRHALVRDAVESALLGRQKRRLHERAFDALRKVDASNDELARHALGAGHYEQFVDLARVGADEFLEAGQTFAALRLADEALREAPDDLVLLYVATRSAWLAGLPDEAAEYAARWVRAGEATGDPSRLASALRWSARIEYERANSSTETAMINRLEALLDAVDDEERSRSLAWLAQHHMLHGRSHEAVEFADHAIREAERIDAKDVAIQARIERASALVTLYGVDGSAELLAAVDEAEAADEWVLVTRGLNNLFDAVPIGSAEGRELIGRFRRAAERAGFDSMATSIATIRSADLAHTDADMETCRRLLEPFRATAMMRRKDCEWLAWWEFMLAAEEGCSARAHQHLLEIEADSAPHKWLDRIRLQLAALDGDPTAGRAALEGILTQTPDNSAASPREVVEIVDDLLRLGVPPSEVRTKVVDGWLAGHPVLTRVGSFVEGLLLAEEGRHAESAARLLTALASPDAWLPRFQLDHLRTVAAAQVAQTGDRAGAKVLVEQAISGLARWPGWRRDRAEALARKLDGRSAPDGVLSAREREVAVLLAEGVTNAELARRLYISPKTAAVHVSNILMKLNMSSRAEVAAWAVRTGLAPDAPR